MGNSLYLKNVWKLEILRDNLTDRKLEFMLVKEEPGIKLTQAMKPKMAQQWRPQVFHTYI